MSTLFAAAVALVVLSSTMSAQSSRTSATYITLPESPVISLLRSKPTVATVQFTVNKGYHVNSNKPSSDLLIPTEIKFEKEPMIAVEKITYPPGEEFKFSFSPGQKLSVYQGQVKVLVRLMAAKRAKVGTYRLKGSLSYQACNDNACFPPRVAPFTLVIQLRQ